MVPSFGLDLYFKSLFLEKSWVGLLVGLEVGGIDVKACNRALSFESQALAEEERQGAHCE